MKNIVRRGEYALLTVTHPLLGTDLEIGASTIRLAPEQYLALTDLLCRLAFLIPPHLVEEIATVAGEIDLREVKQYIEWLREADRRSADRLSIERSALDRKARLAQKILRDGDSTHAERIPA